MPHHEYPTMQYLMHKLGLVFYKKIQKDWEESVTF